MMNTLRGTRLTAALLLLVGPAACNATLEPGNYNTGTPPMLVLGGANAPRGGSGGGDAVPPPNLDPDMLDVPPATRGSRSGVYSGIIEPLDTSGGLCTTSQKVRNFQVRGNSVRW